MADAALPRSASGNHNPWLIAVVVVSIATFMEVLDTTVANVALRHIGGSQAADRDESTWNLTSYLVSNALILPAASNNALWPHWRFPLGGGARGQFFANSQAR